MKIKKKSVSGKVFAVLVPVLVLTISTIAVQRKQYSDSHAAASCSGPLITTISTDGVNFKSGIILPAGKPTKYYLHVTDANKSDCSTSFDVYVQSCPAGVCQAWKEVNNWGTYRSDAKGIARIDLTSEEGWPDNYLSNFKVRIAGSDTSWGSTNAVSLKYQKTGFDPTLESTNFSMLDYFVQKPGWSYLYKGTNENFGTTGTAMIQFEQMVETCGLPLQVWRYTRSNKDVYINPRFRKNDSDLLGEGGDRELRWFVVDPVSSRSSVKYSQYANYIDKYIWGFGHWVYLMPKITEDNLKTPNTLKGISFDLIRKDVSRRYLSSSDKIPKYLLAPLNTSLPFLAKNSYGASQQTLDLVNCPTRFTDSSNALYNSDGWIVRVEQSSVKIDNGPGKYVYSGPAIRIDYYEVSAKPSPMEKNEMLRESWYLVKDVGLVKVVQKHFNHRAGQDEKYAPLCQNDSDCWADDITMPNFTITLENFYPNPPLTVSTSSDGKNYSETQVPNPINKQLGYYLNTNMVNDKYNQKFTGWLEAKTDNGNVFKWRFATNGLVKVEPAEISGFAVGSQTCARFRTWVPNEVLPGEKRIPSASLDSRPWSNRICVLYK